LLEDAVGLLILIASALVALIGAGWAMLCAGELISGCLAWTGMQPFAGWGVLGAALGGLYGAACGMKARGKADDLRKLYLIASVVAGVLLLLGGFSPAGRHLLGH